MARIASFLSEYFWPSPHRQKRMVFAENAMHLLRSAFVSAFLLSSNYDLSRLLNE